MSRGKIHLRGKPHGTTLCGIRWVWNAPNGEHDLDALTWANRDHATCTKCNLLAEDILRGDLDSDERIIRFATQNRRGPRNDHAMHRLRETAAERRARIAMIPDTAALDSDDDPVPA